MTEKTEKSAEFADNEQRAAYITGLESELEFCKQSGRDARGKEVQAELTRVKKARVADAGEEGDG